jgi:hypothetical protein
MSEEYYSRAYSALSQQQQQPNPLNGFTLNLYNELSKGIGN